MVSSRGERAPSGPHRPTPVKIPVIPTTPYPYPAMSSNFDQLVETVSNTRADVEKAEEGNKAATSRVRKQMQAIKNLAQDLRKEMLELRDAGGSQQG